MKTVVPVHPNRVSLAMGTVIVEEKRGPVQGKHELNHNK